MTSEIVPFAVRENLGWAAVRLLAGMEGCARRPANEN
jgi:hypothetical protein